MLGHEERDAEEKIDGIREGVRRGMYGIREWREGWEVSTETMFLTMLDSSGVDNVVVGVSMSLVVTTVVQG